MLLNQRIQEMLKKDFVSRGRVRVRAPSEVKRTRSLGFDRIPSRPPRSEIPHVSEVVYLPRYTWTMEDREIFSIYDMQMQGYCEECSNYGVLRYKDGLYLCANCRYLYMNI